MKTENVIGQPVSVERVGTFLIVRTIDFAKLAAEAPDGKVDVSVLTEGGDWGVKVQPNGKDAEPVTHAVNGMAEAEAFIAGAQAVVAMRKKGPRGTVDENWDPASIKRMPVAKLEADLTRAQLRKLNEHHGLEYKQNDNKAALAKAVHPKLPK